MDRVVLVHILVVDACILVQQQLNHIEASSLGCKVQRRLQILFQYLAESVIGSGVDVRVSDSRAREHTSFGAFGCACESSSNLTIGSGAEAHDSCNGLTSLSTDTLLTSFVAIS
jgi:hypothetical protein